MLTPEQQKALDSIDTFKIEPLSTDMLNGLTTIDMSTLTTSITPSAVGAVGQGYTYTNTGTGLNWQSPNTVWTTSAVGATTLGGKAGQLSLKGEDADLVINGKSMMKLMERIEERLNLLEPNTELEKDWDDLRKLGERYRKLEKKCKEKAEVWNKLKSMPKPEVKW